MQKTRVRVLFPNDDYIHEINIDMDEFKPNNEFHDQTFGWYQDTYISILKDEHDQNKTEKEPSNSK